MTRLRLVSHDPVPTPPSDTPSGRAALPENPTLEVAPDPGPITVLLASDDQTVHRWSRRWLEQLDLEVHAARSVEAAREALGHVTPTVAILDHGIWECWSRSSPGTSGVGRRLDGIPVIVLCTNGRQATAALSAGAAEVAWGPFGWRLVGHRAAALGRAARVRAELESARVALARSEEAAARARQELRERADSDPLTGLPNRRVFVELLGRALAGSASQGTRSAVLLLGLDGFASFNEAIGWDGGNYLLRSVANRLRECLRGDAILVGRTGLVSAGLARIGGDVFAFMIDRAPGADDLEQIGRSILEILGRPLGIAAGTTVYVSASVGIARYPGDGDDHEELVRHAELAMLGAKKAGGGAVRFYDRSLKTEACRRIALDRELRTALERDELVLHYQPILRAESPKVVAAEALIRWQHPEKGLLFPVQFVREAESSGLMVEIGSWVLRRACGQLRTWLDMGLTPLRVAVNVALCQLVRGDLLTDIRRALSEHDVPAELLELELSERGVLSRSAEFLPTLREISALGVRLSIDDFGTGDSAVAHLRSLPIDRLKIDHSFVLRAPLSPDDAVIASAVVAMAHELGLAVVAEGIESSQHLTIALEWGCDELQGFMFSPPQPAEDLSMNGEYGLWSISNTWGFAE